MIIRAMVLVSALLFPFLAVYADDSITVYKSPT